MSDHIEVNGKTYYAEWYLELANQNSRRRSERVAELEREVEGLKAENERLGDVLIQAFKAIAPGAELPWVDKDAAEYASRTVVRLIEGTMRVVHGQRVADMERINMLLEAIGWALGEGESDFDKCEPEHPGMMRYWWRSELRKRSGICVNQEEPEPGNPWQPTTDAELIDWLAKTKCHVMYDTESCTYKLRFRVGQGEFVSDCGTLRGAIRAAIFGVVRRRGING